MKNSTSPAVYRLLRLIFMAFTLTFFAASTTRAGLTFDLRLIRDSQGTSYNFYTEISTNDTPPAAPLGNYLIASPQQPANGTWRQLELTADGFDFVGGGSSSYGDFASAMQQITNGNWTITFTNATTTNHFTFTVSAPNVTSNMLPALIVTTPTENEVLTTAQPTFTWTWANTWGAPADAFVFNNSFSFFQYASIPAAQNNWAVPALPAENLHFQLRYETNSPIPFFPATTPLDTISAQPISGWVSAGALLSSVDVNFSVNLPDAAGGHTNLAYYSFENGDIFSNDESGHGNDIAGASSSGDGSGYAVEDDFADGSHAGFFDGDDAGNWYAVNPPSSLLDTLAGSFSISLWVNTTQVSGDDSDGGLNNVGLVAAFNGGAKWIVPMALTGSKLAFATGGSPNDTLHSDADINTGNYVHLVVTRNQATGEKKIYINGVLDASDTGSTDVLDDPYELDIGGSNGHGLNGSMDEIQIYSGVLDATEVGFLHDNPGSVVADTTGGGSVTLAEAVDTTNLTWTTGGNAGWSGQTTTTHDGVDAVRSGPLPVGNYDYSYIQTTVTGPGTLTFWWQNVVNDDWIYTDFYIDNDYKNENYGENGWSQDGPYEIGPGTHTLYWETDDNGTSDPNAAGFLDQVVFTPTLVPVITLNPFDQTNYPGYSVWLAADATTNSNVSWQWYKVGSGLIAGATNAGFTPTNSGTAGVVGSYYAVASNSSGTANTTTAAVTFVSAPLPPDWTRAFKSPFTAVDNTTLTTDYYYGCVTDTNGNIYAAAEFSGNMLVGTSNLNSGTGGSAAAIVKQSPTGTPLWAAGITNNGAGYSRAYCVATAPGGGVYVSGNYGGDNWLGTNHLADAGNGDFFVARFDASGSNLWVKTFGGTNSDFLTINSLAADPAGNVSLAGLLGSGPVTIGSSNYMVVGQEGVLLQLDQTGAVRWSQLLPGEFPQYLTYDAGRLYVSANTTTSDGTTYVAIGGLSNVTDRAWAVACLADTDGHASWLRGVGGPSGGNDGRSVIDDVPRLAVAGANLFTVGVAYGGSAAFDALTVNFNESRGQYFARYDTNGNAQVAVAFGSPTTTPVAIVANAAGNLYVSGLFDTFSIFGSNLIAAPVATRPYNGAFSQAFLAKFDLNGNPFWARTSVSPVSVNFLGIALASDGVWASGWCNSGAYPQIGPTVFGTNLVWSDPLWLYGGAGGSTSVIFYPAGVLAKITDGAATALPVTLVNPISSGSNFQFSFLSQSGFSHTVLYRTNLATGSWQTYSNVTGDGSLKTMPVPLSLFGPAKQGFIRVSTE